jgi:outer membrane protein assembly factor BamB
MRTALREARNGGCVSAWVCGYVGGWREPGILTHPRTHTPTHANNLPRGHTIRTVLTGAFLVILAGPPAAASDWPQFMRDAAHTGDAADEALVLPLGLVAQVKLDDAVMTSPAVVGGLAYVVDQMGTAYCVDPKAGRVVWKASPDGEKAMGSNTSSPCVAKGRMYFGTTAGNFHILDCKDGKVVKTIAVGSPVISAPTFANDSVYFQALDAVLRCLDLDGNEKWTWDHYKRYKEPPEITKAEEGRRGHPGGYERPHYGGGEVAVSGTKVVASMGWDIFCLEDKGKSAELAWCRRCPSNRDGCVPMSSSISGDWVYTAGMAAEGGLGLMCFALKDGATHKEPPGHVTFPWNTPAVRGSLATGRYVDGELWTVGSRIAFFEPATRKVSAICNAAGPAICSQALAKDHLVAASAAGELLVSDLAPKDVHGAKPLRIVTPHEKPIGSSPAVSGGCVYFGCDDGYFYVYGPGGSLAPRKDEKLAVHEPRSKVVSATGKAYGWTNTRGNPANTSFVDDPGLKPPLKLRWAVRGFGHFLAPPVATAEGDVLTVTKGRLVTCQEQATGRMRWRRWMPGSARQQSYTELLASDGRVYAPCPGWGTDGQLLCLDGRDGRVLWTAPIGTKFFSRASPMLAAGRVVFGHARKGPPAVAVVEAWEAETGKSAWQVPLNMPPGDFRTVGGSCADGCVGGDVVYYSAGIRANEWKPDGERQRGETVAIDARTGGVLWRTGEAFITSWASCPVLTGDRLLLSEEQAGLRCVSAKDGKVLWGGTAGKEYGLTRLSVGPDFIVGRGYGGGGVKLRLEDGKDYPGFRGNIGADTHSCDPVPLTPNCAFASGAGGLCVRDVRTGALLWQSPGFAPRGCASPSLANGRVFWGSAGSGMVFCWEPEARN